MAASNQKEQYEKMLKRKKQLQEQLIRQEEKIKEAHRKMRTKRLIEIGAVVESVFGRPVYKEDLKLLGAFLREQEEKGMGLKKFLEESSKDHE